MIPVANPKQDLALIRDEIDSAIDAVISSGQYILGQEVERFERNFAEFTGAKHCIGVADGTNAIVLALKTLGIKPGDHVITVSHTAVATVAAIELVSAVPLLVDIEPDTYCLSPDALARAITEKTRAVIPVHIYGHPADMQSICEIAKRKNVLVIEDCSQAHGAKIGQQRVGTFGDLACFSFYPTKNLGAIGDGGAIVTDNFPYSEHARQLRQYGWKTRYVSQIQGYNSRLDELQAAILSVKLKYLERANDRRNQIASEYDTALQGSNLVSRPTVKKEIYHARHLYVVRTKERNKLGAFLEKQGIGSALHYPISIDQQPAYRDRIILADDLENTRRLYKECLSIPLFPSMSDSEVKKVSQALKDYQG